VFENAPPKSAAAIIRVKGLKGGHSGLEIDKGRGNSIKIINRVLIALSKADARIATIEGGNKSNAIPREAEALVFVPKKAVNKAKSIVETWSKTIKAELATAEPDLTIVLEELPEMKKGKVITKNLQIQLSQTISALPHGVIKMSADIPGLVETSTNVAIVRTNKTKIELTTSQRSSVATEIDEIVEAVGAVFTLGGAKAQYAEGYPGWKPNLESKILKTAKATYKSLYGKEPEVKAIHAGLECGIIGEKYPGMDMISFGPTLEGVHSPDEKIYIDTVEKFWKYLLEILKNVN
jgi:dipeptidase D